MSWSDFYRRRDAIDLVLAHTGQTGDPHLPFAEFPAVTREFADRDDLALALQYKWSQVLMGRIAVELTDAGQTPDVDHVDAVTRAWRTAAAKQPELRALLDAYTDNPEAGEEFLTQVRAEHRSLALAANLAELDEPTEEISRIGAAFLSLIRTEPQRSNRRHLPVGRFFRRPVASA